MTEQRDQPDDEHFSDWLFYRRKHRRRRVTHRTLSTTQNTDQEEHE